MALTKVTPWMIAETGNQTPVAGSKMKIDYLFEDSSYPMENLGAFWPSGKTETYFGISKEYTSTDDVGPGSPATALLAYATSDNSDADVCSIVGVGRAVANNSDVFAANFIVNVDTGTTGSTIRGVEIDIEPSSGSAVTNSGLGFIINGFNYQMDFAAMQIGTVGGGLFNNGIIVGGVSGGTCLTANAASVPKSLIDTNSSVTYSDDAIIVAYPHSVRWTSNGNTAPSGLIFVNSGNDLNIEHDQGALIIKGHSNTENTNELSLRSKNATEFVAFYDASGTVGNAAQTTMNIRANSVSSRSINAGGTINASGADYAEYEYKNKSCGVLQKGQIVGFDANGKLTDKFAEAISFAVKSTNPNIVGGDTWDQVAGNAPVKPVCPESPKGKPERLQTTRSEYAEQMEHDYQKLVAIWEADCQRYEQELTTYNEQKAAYDVSYAAWEVKLETARQAVDRIAYCGKVPVNVTNANVGDYIVPQQDGEAIKGVAISNPTFEEYQIAVGRVRRILEDGRAEIVVKSI